MTKHLGPALEFAFSQPWAMEEGFHRRMMQVLLRHDAGVRLDDDEVEAATGSSLPKRSAEMQVEKGVATIPIHGVIAHRAGAVGRVSSRVGTSVEHIRADLEAALSNPDVQAIVLDVDSPGGSVSGVDELAAEIRGARGRKPIVAHTSSLMASAAYWLAAQADQVYATKAAVVGSIGVIASFLDSHRAMANEGFDPVVVKSTPAKGGMQSNGTLSDTDRSHIQAEVDAFHELFVEAVAAGRGIDADRAKAMGDGRVYVGREAERLGYVDGIGNVTAAAKMARGLAKERMAAVSGNGPDDADLQDPVIANGDEGQNMKNDTPPATPAKLDATQPSPSQPPTPAPLSNTAEAVEAAVGQERTRCAQILAGADHDQHEQALAFIRDGVDATTALVALNGQLRAARAEASKTASKVPAHLQALGVGNTATVSGEAREESEAAEGEEKWKEEWRGSAELRSEFQNDEGRFLAFKRQEQRQSA